MTSREVKIIDFKKDGLVFVKYEEGGKEKVIKETLDGIEFSNSIIFPRIVIPVRGGNVSETEEINIPRGWDIVLVDYDNYEAGDMNAIEYEGKESSFPHSLFVYVR